jgi:flagellar assembly factor FliW
VKVSTTRFGDISIDETRIIEMKEGMLGFEHLKRYVLLTQDKETPFMWFQSVDDGSLAFVVIHSFVVKDDYEPVISDSDVRLLDIPSSPAPEDIVVLSTVTIRSDPFRVTANLRAPIVINAGKMLAKQVVLVEDEYPVQYPLTVNQTALEKKAAEKGTIAPTPLAP